MASQDHLDIIEDGDHSLLAPPSPAYSNVTVRRAFIVWMCCGQQNKFKDVCNYFHYLEKMEEKLPAHERAISRHHEFDLFSNKPPTSSYLKLLFPSLYSQSDLQTNYIQKVEAIKNEKCVFKLEGYSEITRKNGATANEILNTSQMIRNYCKMKMIPLRKFLEEFKEYTEKCNLTNTVNNVAFYINRKLIEDELKLMADYPKTFRFLSSPVFDEDTQNNNTNIKEVNKIISDINTNKNDYNEVTDLDEPKFNNEIKLLLKDGSKKTIPIETFNNTISEYNKDDIDFKIENKLGNDLSFTDICNVKKYNVNKIGN